MLSMFAGTVAAILSGLVMAIPAPPSSAPSSMAALGDSLSRGFLSCALPVDCPQRSWSTGDDEEVNSHYSRILALNPAIAGNAHNNAQSGAKSAALAAQAEHAVDQQVDYVTIFIGANDACTDSEAAMTGGEQFGSNIDAALAVLAQGLPEADVLVASVPDMVRLQQIGQGSIDARNTWRLLESCQSALANPDSQAAADSQRRDRVAERIDEYNSHLSRACRAYGDRCRYDGGAVHDRQFTMADISKVDFVHLNTAGQRELAEVTWGAGFGWSN